MTDKDKAILSAKIVRAYNMPLGDYLTHLKADLVKSLFSKQLLETQMLGFSDVLFVPQPLLEETPDTPDDLLEKQNEEIERQNGEKRKINQWLDETVSFDQPGDLYLMHLAMTEEFRNIYSAATPFTPEQMMQQPVTWRHILQVPRVYYAHQANAAAEPHRVAYIDCYRAITDPDRYLKETLPQLKKAFSTYVKGFWDIPLPVTLAKDKLDYVVKGAGSFFRKSQQDDDCADVRNVSDALRGMTRVERNKNFNKLEKLLGTDKDVMDHIRVMFKAASSLNTMKNIIHPETERDRLTKAGNQPNPCVMVKGMYHADGIMIPTEYQISVEPEEHVNQMTANMRAIERKTDDKVYKAVSKKTRFEMFSAPIAKAFPATHQARQSETPSEVRPDIAALDVAVTTYATNRRNNERRYVLAKNNSSTLGRTDKSSPYCDHESSYLPSPHRVKLQRELQAAYQAVIEAYTEGAKNTGGFFAVPGCQPKRLIVSPP